MNLIILSSIVEEIQALQVRDFKVEKTLHTICLSYFIDEIGDEGSSIEQQVKESFVHHLHLFNIFLLERVVQMRVKICLS